MTLDTLLDTISDHRQLAERAVAEQAKGGLPITRHAHRKLHAAVDVYASLLKRAGLGSQEFSFYLTGKRGSNLIDDVYVIRDQVVSPVHTTNDSSRSAKPTGKLSLLDLKQQGRKVIAHGHSHGNLRAYFSGLDEKTFYKLNNDLGTKRLVRTRHEDREHEYLVKSFPALVINHDHEVVIREKTQFPDYGRDHGDGHPPFDPDNKENYTDNDITFTLVGDDTPLSGNERHQLEDDLRTRITIDAKRKTMDQLLGEKAEEAPRQERDTLIGRLKSRYNKQGTGEEERAMPVTDAPVKGAIVERYEQLLKENALLKQQNAYLSTRPRATSYTRNITDYSRTLMRSEERAERLLGTTAKLLSGHYRGSIDDVIRGDYREKKASKRLWKWEDRIEAAMRLYTDNKGAIDQVNIGHLDSLKETLHKNYYFRKHHADKLEALDRLFLNIKRTTLSAPRASDRTPYTASAAGSPASSSS